MSDPILSSKRLANGNRFKVHGGLHYIKGNTAPYFSLTYEETTARGRDEGGGAGHDVILKHFPGFADLAALHLSDIDGAPMYALENGFYHLGGTHWQGADLPAVARHFRISLEDAEKLGKRVFSNHWSPTVGNLGKQVDLPRARLKRYIGEQAARWQGEADACVARHGLTIYGDAWPNLDTSKTMATVHHTEH